MCFSLGPLGLASWADVLCVVGRQVLIITMLNRAWGRWANKIQAEGWGWEGRAGRSRARKSSFRGWVSSHWKSKHFKMKSSDDWSSNTHTLPNTYTHTHTLGKHIKVHRKPHGGATDAPPTENTLYDKMRWGSVTPQPDASSPGTRLRSLHILHFILILSEPV